MTTLYDWKRFWFPLGSAIHALDDGYLDDPEAEHGRLFNNGVLSIDEIDELPCLVLLGEPGIGKTTAVRRQFRFATEHHGRNAQIFDLGEYGDEGRLIDEVFRSPIFEAWSSGNETLDLYLDSLDECRLQIPQVARLIASQLERHADHLARLRLRITCRTVEWPAFLTERLESMWGESIPQLYELAPLRKAYGTGDKELLRLT